MKGEKGIQGDKSNVLSVLADHLPIQPVTQYCEKMCFVKYHISEDRLSIIELAGGVGTLRNVSTYHKPMWHIDGKCTESDWSLSFFRDEELDMLSI